MMCGLSWRHVDRWGFRLSSNGQDRAAADTVWIFFEEAVPATVARKLGSAYSHRDDGGIAPNWDWIHTTGSFQTKTRYQKEDSVT